MTLQWAWAKNALKSIKNVLFSYIGRIPQFQAAIAIEIRTRQPCCKIRQRPTYTTPLQKFQIMSQFLTWFRLSQTCSEIFTPKIVEDSKYVQSGQIDSNWLIYLSSFSLNVSESKIYAYSNTKESGSDCFCGLKGAVQLNIGCVRFFWNGLFFGG